MRRGFVSWTLTPRQKSLLGVTALAALVALVLQQWTFPAYDRWRQQAAVVRRQAAVHARLVGNLQITHRVEQQFAGLPSAVFGSGSNEIMFGDFLKRIEMAAGPILERVEPSPVRTEGPYATYRVRLLLSGKLQDVVRFADDLMRGAEPVGVESFRLRATAERNTCDCTFVLWTVRLLSVSQPEGVGSDARAPLSAFGKEAG